MNADKEELSRYRQALASHPMSAAVQACPRPERIWEAANGGLRPPEVAELADHTLGCSDCSLAWQLAVEIGRAPQAPLGLRRPPALLRHRQLWGGLLAAAAAVLLVVTIPWQNFGGRPTSFDRGPQAERAEILRDDECHSRQDCVLRWRSPWPEATYSVKLADETFDLIAEAHGLTAPEFRVPAEHLIGLGPSSVLNWNVEALAPDGTILASRSFESVLE